MSKGMFIAFEGLDGAGKSSQLRRVAHWLRERGHEVVETREPGGTVGAEEIRSLLVTGKVNRWSPQTELLLFNAARRDHLEKVIEPALARGAVVLCDRFADSTRAYQSVGRGVARETVEALHSLLIKREPDLVLVFDLSPDTARLRGAPGREDRYEQFDEAFFNKLRAAFIELVKEAPSRRLLIDAEGDEEQVAAAVVAAIEPVIAVG